MSFFATRHVTLSLAVLLASTSLAQAGFVWLSPDQPAASSQVFTQQAQQQEQTAGQAVQQGRPWAVDPSVPMNNAPVAAPVDVQAAPVVLGAAGDASIAVPPPAPVAPVAPVTLAPAPVVPAPVASVQAQPVYTLDPQTGALVPAPVASLQAPVVPVAGEVTLASTQQVLPGTIPAAQVGYSAPAYNSPSGSASMPSAEALINTMPASTVAVRPAGVPAAAPASPQVMMSTPVGNDTTVPAAQAFGTFVPPMLSPAGSASASPVIQVQPMPDATAPVVPTPSATPAPAPVVSSLTGQAIGSAVYTPAPAPLQQPAQPAQIVDGFGKSVPLAIALRQILPTGYSFAHGSGVDLSRTVDWQGGRAWQQVLNDAIRPVGLVSSLNGNLVTIERSGAVASYSYAAPQNVLVPAAPAPATVAPGQAVLTNATVMQTLPTAN